jgi:hypothetical protein
MMRRPSGLHVGPPSNDTFRVSRRLPDPSAFMTQISVPTCPGPTVDPVECT